MIPTASPRYQRSQMYFFSTIIFVMLVFAVAFPRLSIPLASAYVFAIACRPIWFFYKSCDRRRRILVIVLSLATMASLVYPAVIVISAIPQEFSDLSKNLPRLETLLRVKFHALQNMVYHALHIQMNFDPSAMMGKHLQKYGDSLIVGIPKVMGSLLEWMLLTPVLMWFVLREGKRLKSGFLDLVPNAWFERTYMLTHQFNVKFGEYIIAKGIEALILGSLVMMGLWFIGFPYATLLGVLAGLTNILPYLGPLLGWAPALIVGATQPMGSSSMTEMNIVFLVANFIDMTLVFPLLVFKIVNLHPLIVIASVIIGSQLAGVGGMLVSVPVAAFVKLLLQEVQRSLYPGKSQ